MPNSLTDILYKFAQRWVDSAITVGPQSAETNRFRGDFLEALMAVESAILEARVQVNHILEFQSGEGRN
jgi:hypothetical protein